MIIILPFLLITLHFSQIGLTEGLTFIIIPPYMSVVLKESAVSGDPYHFALHVILPLVRSYGDISTVTLSPGTILI